MSKRSQRLLRTARNKALTKILKKIKNQKKQFKHLDKIFSAKKQQRAPDVLPNDPYILR
jgi:hypothetical protein